MERPASSRPERPQRPEHRRFDLGRYLPVLFMLLIALFIMMEQVPAFNHWLQRIIAPERYAAAETCLRAALDASTQPDYARVRSAGTTHRTRNGFYVEGVEIGEMGPDGAEAVYRFSCYTDPEGKLVNSHKDAAPAPP